MVIDIANAVNEGERKMYFPYHLERIKTVNTWLPVFPGFYETAFQYDEEGEAESLFYDEIFRENFTKRELENLTIDDIVNALCDVVDYKAYEKDVAELATDYILGQFGCGVKSWKFQRINYPREYNFSSDSVDVAIGIDIDELQRIILANKEHLDNWFKDHYTARDGYMPYYPNNFEDWDEETNGFTELDGHYLGAILQAFNDDGIALPGEEPIAMIDVYENVMDDICRSSYYDYDKLIEAVKKEIQ